MKTIILLIIAILPVYLIGLYVYNKDREKEPKKLLTKLFIYGMLACFTAVILELVLGYFFNEEEYMNLFEMFIYAIINIALVEELCKWFIVYNMTYHNSEFDHLYDMVVYSIFTSLGFAVLENILYVYLGGFTVGLFRAVSAIPGHASYAIIMANYLGKAKVANLNSDMHNEKKNLLLSILMPTFAHGLYDYFLFTDKFILLICYIIFLIVIYKYSQNKINYLSNIKDNLN